MNPLRLTTAISLMIFGLIGCMASDTAASDTASPNASGPNISGPNISGPETPIPEASISETSVPDTAQNVETDESSLDCNNAVTQLELNECAYQDYETADAKRNQRYLEMLVQLSPTAQAALTAAELAWTEFRDLDCDFARSQYEGGSIAPLIYYDCLAAKSLTRLTELSSSTSAGESLDIASSDAALNQRYQELLALLTPEATEAVTTVQLSWIDYRDHHCDFEADHRNTPRDQCLARISQTRTGALETMIESRSL